MRTHFITLTALLALAVTAVAGAQGTKNKVAMKADSVLLSQSREGDFTVCKYLVKHDNQDNSDFAVRYRINLSTLSPNLDDNNKELADLKRFMDSLSQDAMIHLNSIEITGYASPDGIEANNQKLAYARGMTLKNYLDEKYGVSKKYKKVSVEGTVENWKACEKALAASNVNGRDKALAVIRGTDTPAEKQRALKAMPAVWSYLKANVLPKLRYADVEFGYNRDEIVEVRTRTEKPKPAPQAKAVPVANTNKDKCCCCGAVVTENVTFVEDLTNGIIVEMDDVDVDWY